MLRPEPESLQLVADRCLREIIWHLQLQVSQGPRDEELQQANPQLARRAALQPVRVPQALPQVAEGLGVHLVGRRIAIAEIPHGAEREVVKAGALHMTCPVRHPASQAPGVLQATPVAPHRLGHRQLEGQAARQDVEDLIPHLPDAHKRAKSSSVEGT